jgi:hypothetical protein
MAIILPALNSVKRKAAVTVCLSNTKNLSLGWYMYMGDNDGRIMHARDDAIVNGNFVGWCGVPSDAYGRRLSNTQTSPAVTDEDEIRGIKEGVLYPYVQDAGAYHCPADNIRKSIYDQTTVFVSYGVPACLGGQIRNFSQISRPATRYVFVESAETRNWNSSHHFVMATPEHDNLGKWGWWGPMAINHGDSSILGFCDGHWTSTIWPPAGRIAIMAAEGGEEYRVVIRPYNWQVQPMRLCQHADRSLRLSGRR